MDGPPIIRWNWQQPDWPNFRWDSAAMAPLEAQFLQQSGVLIGSARHLAEPDRDAIMVDIMADEAVKTSEIEGEWLNRSSVQSSLRRQFGLDTGHQHIPPAERGIAEMMAALYRDAAAPLTQDAMLAWHRMIIGGQHGRDNGGTWRQHEEAMQVVSGPLHKLKIHFQAPPSRHMAHEMERFLIWFTQTAPGGPAPLPGLTKAGIAHLYFVSIHPFEDGNGRVARALAIKALSQSLIRNSVSRRAAPAHSPTRPPIGYHNVGGRVGEWAGAETPFALPRMASDSQSLDQSVLVALSQTIQRKRSAYYDALEAANKHNEITNWLSYFAHTILDAQAHSLALVDFAMARARFHSRFRHLNARQAKAVARMFREGPDGFTGGLSTAKYVAITGTSRATATRDLQELVAMGALSQTGILKSTRYHLIDPEDHTILGRSLR